MLHNYQPLSPDQVKSEATRWLWHKTVHWLEKKARWQWHDTAHCFNLPRLICVAVNGMKCDRPP